MATAAVILLVLGLALLLIGSAVCILIEDLLDYAPAVVIISLAILATAIGLGITSEAQASNRYAEHCRDLGGHYVYNNDSSDLCLSPDGRIIYTY